MSGRLGSIIIISKIHALRRGQIDNISKIQHLLTALLMAMIFKQRNTIIRANSQLRLSNSLFFCLLYNALVSSVQNHDQILREEAQREQE